MSFFNTIRGFGRNSKKKQQPDGPRAGGMGGMGQYNQPNFPNGSEHSLGMYANNNRSAASLKRTYSPAKSNRSAKYAQPTQQYLPQGGAQSPAHRHRGKHHHKDRSPQQGESMEGAEQRQLAGRPPLFMCEPFVRTQLVKGSYKLIVQLPNYVDYDEWMAINVVQFYNHMNKFWFAFEEILQAENKPKMMADPGTEYKWVLPSGKAVSLPACDYISKAMAWMGNKVNDPSIFPTDTGVALPPSFLNDVRGICRQLLRIIAHIYWVEYDKIIHLAMEAHWGSYSAHFLSFVRQFGLVESKELEPLDMLIAALEAQGVIYKIEEVTQPPSAQTVY